jgi:sigma-B regulation protein RsbU (phosphoserine phosphatase)
VKPAHHLREAAAHPTRVFLRADLKSARDALWGEMEVAKHIQTALLPRSHALPGYEAAAAMVPADEVGGDYYDILESQPGETWIAVGDVSGHGVESGLIMMMARTALDTAVSQAPKQPPTVVLASVNRVLRRSISRLGADRYMTMTLLRADGARLVFAGQHQDILVYRAARGTTEVVPTQGAWLGVMDDIEKHVEDQSLELAAGDVVLLYTDGVTEAANAQGEMFGHDRLRQALTRNAAAPVDNIVQSVLREVTSHMARHDDDLTLLVLRKT